MDDKNINQSTLLKRITDRIRELVGGISLSSVQNTKVFKDTSEIVDDNIEDTVNSRALGITDIFTSAEFSSDKLDLDLSTIWSMGDRLSEVGYEDGQSGQANTNIIVLAKTLVYNLRSQMVKRFTASLASATAELKGIEYQQSLAENLQQRKKDYYLFLEQEREIGPSKFSLFLAWFYSIIAIVLVAADIPLARSLTRVAFDLKEWETWVLCLGIAFCTIIFKIIYDEFISSPLDTFASQLNHATNDEAYTDDQKRRIRINQVIRISVKLAVLVFTIVTIYLLAKLRFLAIGELTDSSNSIDSFSGLEGFDPASIVDSSSPFSKNPSLTILTFIVVTIIFPLVGGICMSMGLQIFNNRNSYKRAKVDFDSASQMFSDAAKKSTILVERIELAKKNIEYCEDQEFETTYVEFFESRYSHGFRRGFIGPIHEKLRPDNENDLFAKAEALYFKNIAERVTTNLKN